MELQGTIVRKHDTVEITDTFKKREFVLEVKDGEYSQFLSLQLTQGKCDLLDDYDLQDDVKVQINLRGRLVTVKSGKNEGKEMCFNSIEVWKMEMA